MMITGKVEKKNWIYLVETDVVKFFGEIEAEKLTVEDGRGNKAKLNRLDDGSIKIEYTTKQFEGFKINKNLEEFR